MTDWSAEQGTMWPGTYSFWGWLTHVIGSRRRGGRKEGKKEVKGSARELAARTTPGTFGFQAVYFRAMGTGEGSREKKKRGVRAECNRVGDQVSYLVDSKDRVNLTRVVVFVGLK